MSRQQRYVAQRSLGRVGPRSSAYTWDPNEGVISRTRVPARKPRLTVRCEYPDEPIEPIEVTFSLSPSYGILTPADALGWFRRMLRDHEGFEVETDRKGDSPLSFWSERVRSVDVE